MTKRAHRLALALLVSSAACRCTLAAPVTARYKQGSLHVYLLMKDSTGKVIAVGNMQQQLDGTQAHAQLVFRFRDGSVDDETTTYSESEVFSLVTDHHIQKGPSFPTPLDVTIDVPKSEVTWKETKGDTAELKTQHMQLPNDLANGIIPVIVENTPATPAGIRVSYLTNLPKPRIVKLAIKAQGRDNFKIGGGSYPAQRFDIHVEIGGLAGAVAPLIGKQPSDMFGWVMQGEVPGFTKLVGSFYSGGPEWTVELTAPTWSADSSVE